MCKDAMETYGLLAAYSRVPKQYSTDFFLGRHGLGNKLLWTVEYMGKWGVDFLREVVVIYNA